MAWRASVGDTIESKEQRISGTLRLRFNRIGTVADEALQSAKTNVEMWENRINCTCDNAWMLGDNIQLVKHTYGLF